MKTVRVNGKKTPRLHSPEVRALDDAAATLRSIAVRLDDADEREHMESTAKILDDAIAAYGPKEKEAATEKPKK